jgi:hypothetical protein
MKKLLGLGCVLMLGACGGGTGGTDAPAPVDSPSGTDAPGACVGSDGLPCLAIEGGDENLACDETAPSGADRDINFRLVSRGTSTRPIAGPFEIWTNNTLGADCAADPDNCFELTAGADGMAMGTVPGNWYAYRAPANAGAMTFETVGYNRPPAAAGGTDDITAIDATIFNTAIMLIRSGLTRDMADAILLGDQSDCDGEGMSGVTVRFFTAAGTELTSGTGPTDMGVAYRAGGALPSSRLTTTDTSGGYAAANVPVGDGVVYVVTYGTTENGGERGIIGCESVSVSPGAITIISLGPARTDYEAGTLCATMVP